MANQTSAVRTFVKNTAFKVFYKDDAVRVFIKKSSDSDFYVE